MLNINDQVDIVYQVLPGTMMTDDHLNKCSNLFSHHYGVWSKESKSTHQKAGERCKMTGKELKEQLLFDTKNTKCVMALTKDHELVGSCFSYQYNCDNVGCIKLITQIVVNESYRNHNIAQTMILYSIGTEWDSAGIISPHPHSVLALEKATQHTISLDTICKHSKQLLESCQVPFVKETKKSITCTKDKSIINTEFYVDHTEVLKEISSCKNWKLGTLDEGTEYFAFVFRNTNATTTC